MSLPKPRVTILSKQFKYTPSHRTDIRATFERVRKEQQSNVTTFPQRKK